MGKVKGWSHTHPTMTIYICCPHSRHPCISLCGLFHQHHKYSGVNSCVDTTTTLFFVPVTISNNPTVWTDITIVTECAIVHSCCADTSCKPHLLAHIQLQQNNIQIIHVLKSRPFCETPRFVFCLFCFFVGGFGGCLRKIKRGLSPGLVFQFVLGTRKLVWNKIPPTTNSQLKTTSTFEFRLLFLSNKGSCSKAQWP